MQVVVGALDGATVDGRGKDSDAVVEAASQVLDGAGCGGGITGRIGAIAANGNGHIRADVPLALHPPHREGVGTAVQIRCHAFRQTGSCGRGQERRTTE